MAFTRPIAAAKVRGLETTINEQLIKRVAIDAREETRAVWRKEIARHLRFIAKIRLKPRQSLIPEATWFEWLYAEPFEGSEIGYTSAHLENLVDEGFMRNERAVEDVHAAVKAFHAAVAPELARGEPGIAHIPV